MPAENAETKGMTTIGGAPNIIRGGSHSGNVSIIELAEEGILDAMSSDYVPGSLLQASFALSRLLDRPLHQTLKTVTSSSAAMVGLHDRGVIALGKRADIVRVRQVQETPIVREVYAVGRRVI